ncbi:unnamed protein product [Allacma fusca]|uniref:Uncharacterized protein n=1 Tax=Allacma fusca TaxID=39272 RepID=A0A8J2NYC3_9HEXA|nr:unnamed protein product [Allacma fusca]
MKTAAQFCLFAVLFVFLLTPDIAESFYDYFYGGYGGYGGYYGGDYEFCLLPGQRCYTDYECCNYQCRYTRRCA